MATIGEMNRLVTIQRASDADNNAGGRVRSWSTLRKAWVSAMPVAGKESIVAGTLQAAQPWRIEMHFQDVTTEDRIVAGWLPENKALRILSVSDPDGRRETVLLFCETEPLADG